MYVRALIVFVAMVRLAGCDASGSRPSESSSVVGPSDVQDVPRTVVPGGAVARATGRTKVIVNMNDSRSSITQSSMEFHEDQLFATLMLPMNIRSSAASIAVLPVRSNDMASNWKPGGTPFTYSATLV